MTVKWSRASLTCIGDIIDIYDNMNDVLSDMIIYAE